MNEYIYITWNKLQHIKSCEECFKCTQCVAIYIVHGYDEAWKL